MIRQQSSKGRPIEQKNNKERRIRNPKNYTNFVIFLILFIMHPSQAKKLDVWGTTFPIIEKDIKEFIYERLNQMQENGEIKKLNAKFVKNVKEHTLRPTPVEGITTTNEPKTFYYDPTYILNRNIEDEKGKIIAKAGTVINPLDTVKMHSVLFFIDADDKRQVKWALENAKKHDYVKFILIRGNIKNAGDILKNRIYFDQYGLMTRKFGIKYIPCMVRQADKKLQIEEFALKPESNKAKGSREMKEIKKAKETKKIKKTIERKAAKK